ncbi:MAG: class I SAM-dependent methyltransferase [Anaerolinea sp.]|nr:class I SAM-dependent methyltransferase [Anaerolinea sp.]CAG1013872.1 Cyclopropane-fatty-acyl-phospholipid synthase [Anaerolineae bacterium]
MQNPLFRAAMNLVERNLVPDSLIRLGTRTLIGLSSRQMSMNGDAVKQAEYRRIMIEELKRNPIAVHTTDANQQHYELPTTFFVQILGKRMKYSSCLYPTGQETLDEAEEAMLKLSCERAEVQDGMDILELGCGWGSLCLYLCETYPTSRVTAVSNSRTQREYIMGEAAKRNLTNLEVITADMNDFTTDKRFDRVMSVEMFEHMRNYQCLMERVAGFLKPGGKLFVHIFSHVGQPYMVNTERNWLARFFFTGGVMPSDDLLLYFQRDLIIEDHWRVNGSHYARTLESWLQTFDHKIEAIRPILRQTYGPKDLTRWIVRWRLFFIACAEIMNYRRGNEYVISHYRFARR